MKKDKMLMLQKLNHEDFDKVFRIMEQSFPEDEYRTYEEQKLLLGKEEYQIYILKEDDIAAFAAVWEFKDVMFIEHLAVNPEQRNGGMGSHILQELVEHSDKIICLEVELPIEKMAIRRIGFYERNGFFFNDYEYMQPSISKGRKPVPLRIMTSGRNISEAEFEKIKKMLYVRVYKVEG